MRRQFINCITFGMSYVLETNEANVKPQISEKELLSILSEVPTAQLALIAAIVHTNPPDGEDQDTKHMAVNINGTWHHRECSGAEISQTTIANLEDLVTGVTNRRLTFYGR